MFQFEQLFARSYCTLMHLICWYLERKLSPSVESEIERHLNECRDCRLVLEAATKTLDQHFGTDKAVHAA